jgi:hypothetical protein
MLELSQRGRAYLSKTANESSEREDDRQIERFLAEQGLRHARPFVEYLLELSGLRFTTPLDDIHMYSMEKWRQRATAGRVAIVKDNGAWFNVCASRYPGNCMMHESGSLHFETDLKALWHTSLSRLVEACAFLDAIVGKEARHKLVGVVQCESMRVLIEALGAREEDVVPDMHTWVLQVGQGALVVLAAESIEMRGASGFKYFAGDQPDVESLKGRLGGMLTDCRET